jgi:hypothetical protein
MELSPFSHKCKRAFTTPMRRSWRFQKSGRIGAILKFKKTFLMPSAALLGLAGLAAMATTAAPLSYATSAAGRRCSSMGLSRLTKWSSGPFRAANARSASEGLGEYSGLML